MKIAVNKCYGGFSLNQKFLDHVKKLHPNYQEVEPDEHINPFIIEELEKYPEDASGDCAYVCIVEIPDEATDYFINEYDGYEEVLYVLDGKIHFAF